MALFVRNELYLVAIDNTNNTYTFSDTTTSGVTVGFYEIRGIQISTVPSLYICSGRQYAIRVASSDVTSITFLAPLESATSKSQFTVKTSNNPADVVVFQPDVINQEIYASQEFSGSMYINGTQTDYKFKIIPTSNFQLVGYNTQLSNLLNDCRGCGCPLGSENDSTHLICKSSGICQHSLNRICPANATCGALNGKCRGNCFGDEVNCQPINGIYTCVIQETNTSWFKILIIILLSILVGLILFAVIISLKNYFSGPEIITSLSSSSGSIPTENQT
jgi:hypothetical protein